MILGSIPVLLHHGMIIVGLPYTAQGQMRLDEITGGSPYGASTIAAPDRSRQPSTNELGIGRASCRARVCQHVSIDVVAALLKKHKINHVIIPDYNTSSVYSIMHSILHENISYI